VQSAEISVAASLTKVLCRFSTEFSTVDVENYSYRIPDPIVVQQQPYSTLADRPAVSDFHLRKRQKISRPSQAANF
jgi:hypothetical protein